jgi:DNA uptake protein ComE-like DNA-binding protein
MNKISAMIVQVENIHCDRPRGDFSETVLGDAARLILDGGGIITPLILRRVKDDSFELVNGYFEYYAAVKACELDPIKGESIDAYLIEPDNESIMEAQVKMFRNFQTNSTSTSTTFATDHASTREKIHSAVDQSLTQHIETVLTSLLNQWAHQLQESLTQTLTHQVPTILQSLLVPINQQLNELTQRVAELEKEPLTDKTAPLPQISSATDSPLLIALNQLPDLELQKQCKIAGVSKMIANAIIAQRKKQPFDSEEEIRAIKGLGKQTLQKLVDHFAQTPIQSEPGISSASQVTPSSTHTSEISPPLKNEQESTTPSSELEHSPIQPVSEVSSANQVTPHSALASDISPPLKSEQKSITPSGESEPKPLKTSSPALKTSPPSVRSTEEEQLLVTINNLDEKELISRLMSTRFKDKGDITDIIRKQRPFDSIEAIIKLKGVGKRKWEVIANLLKNK